MQGRNFHAQDHRNGCNNHRHKSPTPRWISHDYSLFSHVRFDAGAGARGDEYKATLEELQYDLQSSILLPENNFSPHKSDL
jgi:hypothetical protein